MFVVARGVRLRGGDAGHRGGRGEELQTPYGYDYWSHAVDGVSRLVEYMAAVGEEERRKAYRVMQPHLRMLGGESG